MVISASRACDIPAFGGSCLLNAFQQGYLVWRNPFNGREMYIDLKAVRAVVFWTKHPAPITQNKHKHYVPLLTELDARQINYYFLYTLNDYETEGFEPGLPPLDQRIKVFQHLSNQIGKERVLWRFDPLMKTDQLSIDGLAEKVHRLGDQLYPYTEKLIFSFVETAYRKVARRLHGHQIEHLPFSEDDKHCFAKQLQAYNQKWQLKLATCAQAIDLSAYGIEANRCIDPLLMMRLFADDHLLMNFLHATGSRKDKGQRPDCLCAISKDIGNYNSCRYACLYCYART